MTSSVLDQRVVELERALVTVLLPFSRMLEDYKNTKQYQLLKDAYDAGCAALPDPEPQTD